MEEYNINPQVTLSLSEYNRLVSMARVTERLIEEKALALYEKHGVCKIHVDAYVRGQNGVCDSIKRTFHFDCSPRYCHVYPTGEFEDKGFAIDQKTRQRISKFVAQYVRSCFEIAFGKQLMSINQAKLYEIKAMRERRSMWMLTVIGWLIAVAMLIAVFIR